MDFAQAIVPHESTGLSPSQIELGYQPRMSYDWEERTKDFSKVTAREKLNREEAQTLASRTKESVEWAKKNLLLNQEKMRTQANKKRREPDFAIKDWVYLSKDNLKVMGKKTRKFEMQNLGPFQILEKKGHSFLLDLPPHMRVHPVFHADRLRKAAMDPLPGQYEEPPPPEVIYDKQEWEVEEILTSRLYYNKLQYKVKWKGWDDDHGWYYRRELQRQSSPAEGVP